MKNFINENSFFYGRYNRNNLPPQLQDTQYVNDLFVINHFCILSMWQDNPTITTGGVFRDMIVNYMNNDEFVTIVNLCVQNNTTLNSKLIWGLYNRMTKNTSIDIRVNIIQNGVRFYLPLASTWMHKYLKQFQTNKIDITDLAVLLFKHAKLNRLKLNTGFKNLYQSYSRNTTKDNTEDDVTVQYGNDKSWQVSREKWYNRTIAKLSTQQEQFPYELVRFDYSAPVVIGDGLKSRLGAALYLYASILDIDGSVLDIITKRSGPKALSYKKQAKMFKDLKMLSFDELDNHKLSNAFAWLFTDRRTQKTKIPYSSFKRLLDKITVKKYDLKQPDFYSELIIKIDAYISNLEKVYDVRTVKKFIYLISYHLTKMITLAEDKEVVKIKRYVSKANYINKIPSKYRDTWRGAYGKAIADIIKESGEHGTDAADIIADIDISTLDTVSLATITNYLIKDTGNDNLNLFMSQNEVIMETLILGPFKDYIHKSIKSLHESVEVNSSNLTDIDKEIYENYKTHILKYHINNTDYGFMIDNPTTLNIDDLISVFDDKNHVTAKTIMQGGTLWSFLIQQPQNDRYKFYDWILNNNLYTNSKLDYHIISKITDEPRDFLIELCDYYYDKKLYMWEYLVYDIYYSENETKLSILLKDILINRLDLGLELLEKYMVKEMFDHTKNHIYYYNYYMFNSNTKYKLIELFLRKYQEFGDWKSLSSGRLETFIKNYFDNDSDKKYQLEYKFKQGDNLYVADLHLFLIFNTDLSKSNIAPIAIDYYNPTMPEIYIVLSVLKKYYSLDYDELKLKQAIADLSFDLATFSELVRLLINKRYYFSSNTIKHDFSKYQSIYSEFISNRLQIKRDDFNRRILQPATFTYWKNFNDYNCWIDRNINYFDVTDNTQQNQVIEAIKNNFDTISTFIETHNNNKGYIEVAVNKMESLFSFIEDNTFLSDSDKEVYYIQIIKSFDGVKGTNLRTAFKGESIIDKIVSIYLEKDDLTFLDNLLASNDIPKYIKTKMFNKIKEQNQVDAYPIYIDKLNQGVVKPNNSILNDKDRMLSAFKYNKWDLTGIKGVRRSSKYNFTQWKEKLEAAKNNLVSTLPDLPALQVEITPQTELEQGRDLHKLSTKFNGKHGNIAFKILEKYKFVGGESPEMKAFKAKYPKPVVVPVYHGTGSVGASFLLRFGFAEIPAGQPGVAGKMLGPGLYFSGIVEKAVQYLNDYNWSRDIGDVGYILEAKAYIGEPVTHYRATATRNPDHETEYRHYRSRIKSEEYVVKQPLAQFEIMNVYKCETVTKTTMNNLVNEFLNKYPAERNNVYENKKQQTNKLMIFEEYIKQPKKYLYSFEFVDDMFIYNNRYYDMNEFIEKYKDNRYLSFDAHQQGYTIYFETNKKLHRMDKDKKIHNYVIHNSRKFEAEHTEIFYIFKKCLRLLNIK